MRETFNTQSKPANHAPMILSLLAKLIPTLQIITKFSSLLLFMISSLPCIIIYRYRERGLSPSAIRPTRRRYPYGIRTDLRRYPCGIRGVFKVMVPSAHQIQMMGILYPNRMFQNNHLNYFIDKYHEDGIVT